VLPLLLVALALTPFYLSARPQPSAAKTEARPSLGLPALSVLLIAGICFFTNTAEGAVGDWSALYLATIRHLPDAVTASGYAAFALVMAASRFVGGPIVTRLGERKVVLFGGVFIALGMAVVILSPRAVLSPFGFAIIAAGAANNYPVLISASSRIPGSSAGQGVAAVATGGLLGFLIGPPVIGFVAQGFGLAAGIGILILVGLVVVAAAALYRWPVALASRELPAATEATAMVNGP
jgi:MFS family permease